MKIGLDVDVAPHPRCARVRAERLSATCCHLRAPAYGSLIPSRWTVHRGLSAVVSPCAALTRGLASSQGRARTRMRRARWRLPVICAAYPSPRRTYVVVNSSQPKSWCIITVPLCLPPHAIAAPPPSSLSHSSLTSFCRFYASSPIHLSLQCPGLESPSCLAAGK
jgi:hypothetical protein